MTGTSYEIAECPACGSTHAVTIRDHDQLRDEFEALWQFHLARLRAGVPVARLFDRAFFTQAPPLQLVECVMCGTLYRNPRERTNRIEQIYAEDVADEARLRVLHEAARSLAEKQVRTLTSVAGKAGRGLEVGSYAGSFLAVSAEHGWEFEGVDVNEPVNDFVRSLGFTVHHGSIQNVEDADRYDAVVFWNVFDQLPDPRGALVDARRLLHPGGGVAIRVPNGAFYTRVMRASLPRRLKYALLAWNNLLAFPYRHGFTPPSLTRLLEAHEFDVVHVRRDALVPIADAWTRPWAKLEERIVKGVTRAAAPWFEVYARARR